MSSESFEPEFIAIPYAVFTDHGISHAAKLVFGRLRLYAGKDGHCCPKHQRLAGEVCLQQRQLKNVLAELRAAGWIDWTRTPRGCLYTLSDRQKIAHRDTSDRQQIAHLIGKKLPIEQARNCPSIEKKNEKKLEKKTCASDDAHMHDAPTDEPTTVEPDTLFPTGTPERTKPSRGEMTSQQRAWFTDWWSGYWLHRDRKRAKEAFQKQVKTPKRFAEVMAATRSQSPEMLTRAPKHRPHGATWLNGERWEDELETPRQSAADDYPELTA